MLSGSIATSSSGPLIACHGLGRGQKVACCFANNQNDTTCKEIFSSNPPAIFQNGCPTGNCIADCSNPTQLFGSLLQDNMTGPGTGPRLRFSTCASLPSIVRAKRGGYLAPEFRDIAQRLIPMPGGAAGDEGLRKATAAVTDCISSTCRNSRGDAGDDGCFEEFCSPTRLLVDNTTPNINAINSCLSKLCSMEKYGALPFADSDVIGIGVFSSYILQCILLALMTFRLIYLAVQQLLSSMRQPLRPSEDQQATAMPRGETTLSLLDSFHKAQCWFMTTLMVAAFRYEIFERNTLVLFLIMPLTLNGILPVALAHLLLVYFRLGTLANTMLTLMSYILSSIVYWILYASSAAGVVTDNDKYLAYQQFIYKMSKSPACGGYSGLAACPDNLHDGIEPAQYASAVARKATPAIWAISTTVLLGTLTAQILDSHFYHAWHKRQPPRRQHSATNKNAHQRTAHCGPAYWLCWIAVVTCLVFMFAQLGLLFQARSLDMMDTKAWNFGQVVAVVVWVPPVVECFYSLIHDGILEKRNMDTKYEMESLLHEES